MVRTHYEILGVEPNASPEAIKRRFRELARRYHPDVLHGQSASISDFGFRISDFGTDQSPPNPKSEIRNPKSEEPFVRILEAYRVLQDPAQRAEYDLSLAAHQRQPEKPSIAVGTRAEIDFGGVVLVSRVRALDGQTLHLAVPPGARRSAPVRAGAAVKLTLYPPRGCLEAEGVVRQWVWTQPPLLLVEPIQEWRERQRRRASRAERELAACVTVSGGGEFHGRTRDVSREGVSLMVEGPAALAEGMLGALTLRQREEIWCEAIPIRIARLRNWLQPASSRVEIGAELRLSSAAQIQCWQHCLARLGVIAE